MDSKTVKDYFSIPAVVSDYLEAAEKVGLWASEKIVVEKFVPKTARILELGCGAGRIAHGLCALGYADILATDFSENMVRAAQSLGRKYADSTTFAVCDATKINLPDESFDAVIFGFNGLMQIPKAENRRRALREIFRVLKFGGVFVFTTHERDVPENADYWSAEEKQWRHSCQNPVLDDFGDVFYKGDHGNVFIHSPTDSEISAALFEAGFAPVFSARRSSICAENAAVEDFSDDCVFRVVKKIQSKKL